MTAGVCLLVALALAADTASSQETPSVRDSLLEAERLADAGKWLKAKEILGETLEAFPDDARLHYNLGYVLERLGDRQGARASYRNALDDDPALAVATVNLATMFMAERRFDEAEAILRRGLVHGDGDGSLHYHLALTLFLRTENVTESALEALETAHRLGYRRPHLFALLARAARVDGEAARARTLLKEGLALDPEDALLLREMGLALVALDEPDAGIEWLERANARNPADLDVATELSQLYLRRGRAKEAAELAESALARHTDAPSLLYVLGRARQALGDPRAEETLRRFEEARKKSKNPGEARKLRILDPSVFWETGGIRPAECGSDVSGSGDRGASAIKCWWPGDNPSAC